MNDDRRAEQSPYPRSSMDESGVDARGYMAAIGRSKGLIALIVLICTSAVLAISLVLPNNYQSIARISLDDQTGVFGVQDAESTKRRLATLETLITSREVLAPAAAKVPGEDFNSLESSVTSSVDQNANIINVVAEDRDAEQSALIAQAVATSFLNVQARQERQQLQRAEQDLRTQIDVLSGSADPEAAAQIRAIQDQLSQITVQIELAGSELQIAQPAEVPTAPASPRPVRNTILALFGSLFIGILIALARDQLRPTVRSPREVSRLFGGVPILASVPYVRRRLVGGRRAVTTAAEHEAYQTLRAEVRAAVPAKRHAVILVTSAIHAEGKTTVTARLGKALAQAGHSTLIISGDLRVPTMQRIFDLPLSPGVSEAIERFGGRKGGPGLAGVAHNVAPTGQDGKPLYELDVITSGAEPPDPSQLLASNAADTFFQQIREFDYDYVLIDGPPLLGIADVQALAPHADELLMVGRLDRLRVESVIESQELLARLDVHPLGLVLIGAQVEGTPYHYLRRYVRGRGEPSATPVT